MEIRIVIKQSHFIAIMLFLISVSALGIVVAYGGTSPNIMGHTIGELMCGGSNCDANFNNVIDRADQAPPDSDWTEAGGNVYRTNGNVGIGTSAPSQKLQVTGSARFDNKIGVFYDPNDLPAGWGGGLVTWDVHAKAGVRASTLCLGGAAGGNDLGVCRNSWPDVPAGTMCGYWQNCGGLKTSCMGFNPGSSCPSGWTRVCWDFCGTSGTQTACVCAKN